MTQASGLPDQTVLIMLIEQAKQLERMLQLGENLEQRQDSMQETLNHVLKVINGNGDGKGGLRTASALQQEKLDQAVSEVTTVKTTLDEEWVSDAKRFFSDKRQITFGWKQLVTFGVAQWAIFMVVQQYIGKIWPK